MRLYEYLVSLPTISVIGSHEILHRPSICCDIIPLVAASQYSKSGPCALLYFEALLIGSHFSLFSSHEMDLVVAWITYFLRKGSHPSSGRPKYTEVYHQSIDPLCPLFQLFQIDTPEYVFTQALDQLEG